MVQEHYDILKQGVLMFNHWRKENPRIQVDLAGGDFSGMDLAGVNLSGAYLQKCIFRDAKLIRANLSQANISEADFTGAKAGMIKMDGVLAQQVKFNGTDLCKARMRMGHFNGSDFRDANLDSASFKNSIMKDTSIDYEMVRSKMSNVKGLGDISKMNRGDFYIAPNRTVDGIVLATAKQDRITNRKTAVWAVFLFAFCLFAGISTYYYNQAKKKFGDPGHVIGAFMSYTMGNYFMGMNKPDKALECYKVCVKKQPRTAIYHYKLAYCYYVQNKIDLAERYYERFTRLKPTRSAMEKIQAQMGINAKSGEEMARAYEHKVKRIEKTAQRLKKLGINEKKIYKMGGISMGKLKNMGIKEKDLRSMGINEENLKEYGEKYKNIISAEN